MESYDANAPASLTSAIPQGLLEPEQNILEKNVDESQMAEFSTPLDEVVPQGPAMQLQNMEFGSPMAGPPVQQKAEPQQPAGRKIPFGLTHEQYMAALAGLAAVISTSKPIQERLSQLLPNVEPGSAAAMAVTAAVAAIVFYLAYRFLN